MCMFKVNTIGARVNEILKKHGEDVYCGVSFEDQVKNSSKVFKNICTLNRVDPEKKSSIFNPYSGKSALVEDWIAFIHHEILMLQCGGHNWTRHDAMVFDSIKIALMLEYSEIYYDYFD